MRVGVVYAFCEKRAHEGATDLRSASGADGCFLRAWLGNFQLIENQLTAKTPTIHFWKMAYLGHMYLRNRYLLAAKGAGSWAIFLFSRLKDWKGPVVEKAFATKAGMLPPGFQDKVYSTWSRAGEGDVMVHSAFRNGILTV